VDHRRTRLALGRSPSWPERSGGTAPLR
jgi:hypothetical protein